MRKSSLRYGMFSCLLGIQLFSFVAAHAHTTGAYKGVRNGKFALYNDELWRSPAETIGGKVLSADGKPIAGVSVAVKGSKRGASTNQDGIFAIDAKSGDVL